MNRAQASFLERYEPATGFSYPDDTSEPPADRNRDIRALEWAAQLAFSGRTPRVGRMTISVAIAILRNDLDLAQTAEHFHVTVERVAQIARKVKSYGLPSEEGGP